ncbi:MAG: NAD+ synthase [Bacteroidota bacterium]
MKISIAQLNYHIGNFESNKNKMIAAIQQAKAEQADLVVFSELSMCGYPPRDFLEFNDFIKLNNEVISEIAQHCTNGIAAIVGSPTINPQTQGKDLFNSALFLHEGKIAQTISKTLLPNYDVFDEYRYFEPNRHFEVVNYKGKKLAITICEDLWNLNGNPMYIQCPMDELIKQAPDCIINIAASPFSKSQKQTRFEVLQTNAIKYKLPLVYVNHIGAQTQLIFDGGSCVLNAKGELVQQLKYFAEDNCTIVLDDIQTQTPIANVLPATGIDYANIESALVLGIKEYFHKQGFTKAILGLSGGVDSALVVYLAAKALGAENVLAVMLPSQYSSDHSVSDSQQLVKNLGVQSDLISIENTFEALQQSLSKQFANRPFSIAEENMQSRSRAVILMAIANKFGYILLNTSNKSELAVGYGTLYGDMCGGLSVIGDLYKTEVYGLCQFINSQKEIIPANILSKAPSAELRPNQKDSDSLPDYEVLDAILFHYIEQRKGPDEIIALGFEEALVKRTLKMVNTNEWKRLQAPPVLRVSAKAFGPGRRMPLVAKYLG